MKKLWVTGVSILCTLTGCSSDLVTGGDLLLPNEPTGTVIVTNQTDFILDTVLLSRCKAGSYGLDRLEKGEVIQRGASRSFLVSAGCWDVAGGAVGIGDNRQRFSLLPNATYEYILN